MVQKDSLCSYFSDETLVSKIKEAELAFEPIFTFLGNERGNLFIKRFTECLKTNPQQEFDFNPWFNTEDKINAAKIAITPLVIGLNEKILIEQEIKETVEYDIENVINHINSHSPDSTEKEFKDLISYVNKYLSQEHYDFNTEHFKKKEQLRESLINKAFYNLTSLITEEANKIIPLHTAFNGTKTHAILNSEFISGRYSRSFYETVCSPKKDLSHMENRLNEGGVDCDKCLIKLFNIVKNKATF